MSARRMYISLSLSLVTALGLVACGGDDTTGEDGPLGGSLSVSGDVVDFQTGAAISSSASVTTSGLLPAPQISAQGASFTITGIPENSAFQIFAGAPPTHRSTFSQAVVVTNSDVSGIKAPAVSETYLTSLATGFNVTPTAARGVLFVRLVDANGMPKAGVAAATFPVTGGVIGPKFLDANMMPDPQATTSSASGYAVFFEVTPGVVSFAQAASATVTLDMAVSPVNAGAVTIADAKVTDGAPVLPTNVSFLNTVYPIFANRGCVACHSGGGPGKDLGGLHLDGGANLAYRELVTERPNTRVQTAMPEKSFVLTFPSREDPPDRHPNITFAGPNDPDYIKILVWIREGAKNN